MFSWIRELGCNHKWKNKGKVQGYSMLLGQATFVKLVCKRCGKVKHEPA